VTYVFDIDGTICSLTDGNYVDAKSFPSRIEKINDLYEDGNRIILYTARGMGRTKNNVHLSYSYFYGLTMKQLKEWGVKYHQLFLGKPAGDVYVDDKGTGDKDFFGD
jgi:hypothetical protein